jgi:hypothetical protein
MKYVAFVELYNCVDLAFAARAVGDDDNRPQLWHMKVEEAGDGLLVLATDGRRLHKAQINKKDAPDVSPGYWRVLKNKSIQFRDCETEDELGYCNRRVYIREKILWLAKLDEFGYFPSDDAINRVYPNGTPLTEGVVSTHKNHLDSMNALIKNLPDSAGINMRYLKDLGPYEWKYTYSPEKAVLFEHENKTALIMPLRLN